ncbi:MAG: DUF4129 domain-containing protein [Bacteroidota bacterium]
MMGSFLPIHAQEVRKFDEEKLESYRNNPNYDYGIQPAPEEKDLNVGKDLEEAGNWRVWRYALFGVIIVALIMIAALLIREYSGQSRRNKELSNKGLQLEFDPRILDINKESFDQRIIDAEQAKDYRLAIRWRFLALLKKLNEGKRIIWQINKTNRDYYREIKNELEKDQFDDLALVYDYAWYGDFLVNESQYNKVKESFGRLMKKLS